MIKIYGWERGESIEEPLGSLEAAGFGFDVDLRFNKIGYESIELSEGAAIATRTIVVAADEDDGWGGQGGGA